MAFYSSTQLGGSGAGLDVTGTPLDNQVAVFTDANTLQGDANFTFDAATDTLLVTGDVEVDALIKLRDDAGGQYVGIKAPTTVTSYTLTMPAGVGTTGQVLSASNGSGTLAWTSTTSISDADGDTKVQAEESADEDKIRFDAGGVELMTIDPTGVGIGTASPSNLLDIYNSGGYSTRFSGNGIQFTRNGTAYIDFGQDGSGGTSGMLQFRVTDSNTPVLHLNNDGNVGIGTTTPGHPLTVYANPGATGTPAVWLHNSGNLADYDGTVISNVNDGADAEVLHVRANNTTYNGGTSLMLVRGDGNVGIGTTTPGHRLHVVGGNVGTGTYGTASTGEGFRISSTEIYGQTSATDKVKISGTTADSYFLNNVGIGTNAPTRLLTLENDTDTVVNNSQLRINNTGVGDAYIYMNAGTDWSFGIDNSDADKFKFNISNDVSDGTEVLTLQRDGNVGIGTTAPSANLHVVGSDNDTSILRVTDGTRILELGAKSGVGTFIDSSSGNNLGFGFGGAALMTFESDGAINLAQISEPGTTTDRLYNDGGDLKWDGVTLTGAEIGIACSDETTAITVGKTEDDEQKASILIPRAMTVTEVKVNLYKKTSSTVTIDVNYHATAPESAATLLNAALSMTSTNLHAATSTFASSATSYSLAENSFVTVDVDAAGTDAVGLKVWLLGYWT